MAEYASKAYVYYAPGDVRTETISVQCDPRALVIKVLAAGRCGTDKTIYRKGHYRVDKNAPVVLGHELVGEIVEVGPGVASITEGIGCLAGQPVPHEARVFSVGERVTVQGRVARYRDGVMLLDNPINNLSFYIHGAFAQYMFVPWDFIASGSVFHVPDSVDDVQAALVEPAACALESIFSTPHPAGIDREGRHLFRAGVRPGGNACVIGSGTVSMIYALLARIEGAARVIMLVRSQAKADLVSSILADKVETVVTPNLEGLSVPEKLEAENAIVRDLEALTGGYLFDDVVAACPDPDAQRLMLKLYNRSGYAVGACFGGTHELVDRADIDQHHYRLAKTIGTSGPANRTMQTVLDWMAAGKLDLRRFVSSRRYTFDVPPREFFSTASGGLKPILFPWE